MSAGIKLIAIDLDGTLVHDGCGIPERNVRALRMVQDQGVTVAIATGRMHTSARTFVSRLGIAGDTPIISYNGAMIRLPEAATPMLHVPVPAALAAEIVQLSVDERLHLNYYLDDIMYSTHIDRWSRLYYRRTGDFAEPVGDLRQFAGTKPTKLLIESTPAETDRLLPLLQERFAQRVYVTRSMPEYIEFLNPEASKGHAVEWLAGHLGLAREQVMAIGDNLNDEPMIRWAGVGVAMPKAHALTREAAQFVPEHEEEGVAEALERYFG
jgi:Cof subfamily protein (haloacid dehalogenase superfamily)